MANRHNMPMSLPARLPRNDSDNTKNLKEKNKVIKKQEDGSKPSKSKRSIANLSVYTDQFDNEFESAEILNEKSNEFFEIFNLEFMNENNQLNLAVFKSNEFQAARKISLNGLELATDYLIYEMCKKLAEHPNKKQINVDEIDLKGCKYLTIWSLYYLNKTFNKGFNNFKTQPVSRFYGCDSINQNIYNSFKFKNNSHEESIGFNTSKVVIINEDNQKPILSNLLSENSNDQFKMFNYLKIENSNKIINLFECTEKVCNIFISERNLIIITYDLEQAKTNLDSVKASILRRLFKVLTQNILPSGISLIGFSQLEDTSFNLNDLKKSIINEIKNQQLKIQKSIDSLTSTQTLTFESHQQLSNSINLNEQLTLILNVIHFGTIHLEQNKENRILQLSSMSKEEINSKIEISLRAAEQSIQNLSKSDLVEIKAIKAPPTVVNQVAEAVCILFSKTPDYNNFKKLIDNSDFVRKLVEYDRDAISDYAINELTKYINDSNFNPENMNKVSRLAAVLCQWVKAMYDYATLKRKFNEMSLNSCDCSTLTEFIFKNSCYSFGWSLYYEELYAIGNRLDIEIDALIETKLIKLSPLITQDEFYDIFDMDTSLAELQFDHAKLPFNVLRSNSARGNFILQSDYVITDFKWLANLFETLISGPITSDCDYKIENMIGKNVPIWVENDLKEKLKSENIKIDNVMKLLEEMNLIIKKKDSKNDKIYIIPLCLLCSDLDENKKNWLKDWNGLEFKIEWNLLSPISFIEFSSLITHFYGNTKTKLIWKNGLINRDIHCDILIEYSESKIELNVRSLDPEKHFNMNQKQLVDYFKFIYMEYYLSVLHLLQKNNISYQLETCSHSVDIPNYKDYFQNKFLNTHLFNLKTETVFHCQNCDVTLDYHINLLNMKHRIYPNSKVELLLNGKDYTSNLVDLSKHMPLDKKYSIKLKTSMYIQTFTSCEFKFIEPDFDQHDLILNLNTGSDVIVFDLKRKSYKWKLKSGRKLTRANTFIDSRPIVDGTDETQIVISKLTHSNDTSTLNQKLKIKENDSLHLKIIDLRGDYRELRIYFNNITLMSLLVNIKTIIIPELVIESSTLKYEEDDEDDNDSVGSDPADIIITKNKSKFIVSCQKLETKTDFKDEFISNPTKLIGLSLEARDRLNPHLLCVATIADVKENNQVLIHFDGWTSRYDYWCELSDPDLMPCGFYLYKVIHDGTFHYKGLSSFNPPKGYLGVFKWEQYFQEENLRPVPFELFTDEQNCGMTEFDFVDIDFRIPTSKCDSINNPRVKLKQANAFASDKDSLISFYKSGLKIYNNENLDGIRGFLILPKNIDSSFLDNPSSSFLSNGIIFHMSCVNLNSRCGLYETPFNSLYSHMIDVNGISIEDRSLLSLNDLILIMYSSLAIATIENSNIIPSYKYIFPLLHKAGKINHLTSLLRAYFMDTFLTLAILLDSSCFKPLNLTVDIKKYMDTATTSIDLEKLTFRPIDDPYDSVGRCIYCELSTYRAKDLTKKLKNKYASCSNVFHYIIEDEDNIKPEAITVDNNFIENYKDIVDLIIQNVKLIFDKEEQFFKRFKYLNSISLINNKIETFPSSILSVKKLRSLNLIGSSFKNFNTTNKNLFKHLKHLETFELNSLPLTAEELNISNEFIKLPESIKKLSLINLRLNIVPFDLKQCKEKLNELIFSGIKLIDSDKFTSGTTVMINRDAFNKSMNQILNQNEIDKLFDYFDWDKNSFLNSEELIKLNAFLFRKYPRLGDNFTLDDCGNPEIINSNKCLQSFLSIFELTNLTMLDLSFQAIRIIPDQVEALQNLEKLILNDCIQLEILSPKLANLTKLNEINLYNCISLKTPPIDVCRRGFLVIISYLKRLSSGSVKCSRTKLMLVGLGDAGKTSLFNALTDSYYDGTPQVTDGIQIKKWEIDLESESKLTYSMWDFAGQSVYYNTHQFFLTSRAVYLLVWNVRLGSEYANLDFWLSSISVHAPGAPIFVVGTHIDQVSKYTLDQDDYKSRYKQIVGFHFVSSYDYTGIPELTKEIINVTLKQNYIGETIPKVWFYFENAIVEKSKSDSLISYDELIKVAELSGIFEKDELQHALRFLSDLGTVQYFEKNGLNNKIVINPQWIVDVMACVVTVKESVIENGKLYHQDLKKIWSNYSEDLHDWMLNLTQVFDLTFRVNNQNMNIVPCLLPEKESEYKWPDLKENKKVKLKEFKVLYHFIYLPAGLFNRLQVRLYQYSDNSIIWKNGSFLSKNNHIALVTQTKKSQIQIKVQGIKPENIIFIIHEVIETLINESFQGIQYDYSFPCPDCVEAQSSEPCQFSSTLLRRAYDFKAPFLQCNKFFHIVSIPEMLAIMPIEGANNLDLNLDHSLRDINKMKNNLKYDILFWYCDKDTHHSDSHSCNPLKVIELIRKENYKIWYSKNPAEEKIDKLTLRIKETKLIILGLSEDFAKDEKCIQIYELVKNLIQKDYLLIEFGKKGASKWTQNPIFAPVCTDSRVILQDPKRFEHKIAEMFEAIDRHLKDIKADNNLNNLDVFISYRWSNSHRAVEKGTQPTETSLGWLDPRMLVEFFKENNINAWIDVEEGNKAPGLFGQIAKGMNEVAVVIACLSDEYCDSQNCLLEFRFAHSSLKKPIIKCIVGLSDKWRKNEIDLLSGNYPEINFQHENKEGLKELLKLVKIEIEKAKKSKQVNDKDDEETRKKQAEYNNAAIEELYELTQRRFLKQIIQFSDKMNTSKAYPRLFFIDLIENDIIEMIQKNIVRSYIQISNKTSQTPCVRFMCEHEEGWHPVQSFIVYNNLSVIDYAYLTRIMNILKCSKLMNKLQIFQTDEGQKLISEIETKSEETDLVTSFCSLRKNFISEFENGSIWSNDLNLNRDENSYTRLGLERCELKNGKILWLCAEHVKKSDGNVMSNTLIDSGSLPEQTYSQLLTELSQVKLDIY